MNKGVAMATGDWIIFLGADDAFFGKEVLSLLCKEHEKELQQYDIVYGGVVYKETYQFSTYHKTFNKYQFDHCNLNHQAIFYHKSVFEKIGLFSLEYPVFADWEYNIRCFFNEKITTKYIPLIISYFSIKGVSNTQKDLFYDLKESYITSIIDKGGKKSKVDYQLYKSRRASSSFMKILWLKILRKIAK